MEDSVHYMEHSDGDSTSRGGGSIVRESLEWYRDRFHQVTKVLLFSVIGNIVLALMAGILIFSQKEPRYYAVTPDLRIQEMASLSEPYIPNAGLTNWVAQTVTSTLNLNFRNWRDQLGAIRSAYDPTAFESLIVAMKKNGILSLIEEKRLVCSAAIQDAPIIHASGMQKGVYMWRLKMPVLLSYESSRGVEFRQELTADILVQRVSTLKNPLGIDIRQVLLKEGK